MGSLFGSLSADFSLATAVISSNEESKWGTMVEKSIIKTKNAPTAGLPLSQGVKVQGVSGLIYTSGFTPRDPGKEGCPLVDGDIGVQTERSLLNLKAVLEEAGASFQHVVKVNVFLTDIRRDFKGMNEVYAKFFPDDRPARTTVEAKLAVDTLVEIEMIAAI